MCVFDQYTPLPNDNVTYGSLLKSNRLRFFPNLFFWLILYLFKYLDYVLIVMKINCNNNNINLKLQFLSFLLGKSFIKYRMDFGNFIIEGRLKQSFFFMLTINTKILTNFVHISHF